MNNVLRTVLCTVACPPLEARTAIDHFAFIVRVVCTRSVGFFESITAFPCFLSISSPGRIEVGSREARCSYSLNGLIWPYQTTCATSKV